MAEYYAVERSPEYLMHYGVKGMKWGVRKARQLGLNTGRGAKKLAKQYAKASKKLEKLNKNANVQEQHKAAEKYEKIGKGFRTAGRVGLGMAIPGTAGILAARLIRPKIWDRARSDIEAAHIESDLRRAELNATDFSKHGYRNTNEMIDDMNRQSRAIEKRLENDVALAERTRDKRLDNNLKFDRVSGYIAPTGVGMALAGYGGYGINKLKARKARKLASKEGHKAAIAERDAWQREMNKAFAGTKYAGNSRKTQVKMTQKQKRAYERAYGKPTLSRADANALAAIASNPEKYRVKKRK